MNKLKSAVVMTMAAASVLGASAMASDLNVMVETPVESLDPQIATDGTSFEVIADYTDGLMQMDADGKAVEALAESYDLSDDGTVYTFHIREDANWSNGEPVTAADFVFAWQRAVDPDVASEYSYMMSDIGQIKNAAEIIAGEMDKSELGVTAVDDKTLKVELNVPVSYFTSLMYFPTFYPVYEAGVEEADPDGTVPGKWAQEAGFVCNGAYTLETWTHNESMVYVKNPNYYDAANVTMDELHFMLSADDTAIYAAYNSGDLDYIDTVPNDEISSLNGINPEFGILDNLGTYYIGFNVNDPIFDGKTEEEAAKMREAISLLVDRQFIVENVGQTGQIPADSFVPEGMADGNGGVFKTADTSYYDATATGAGELETAKGLLEEAGYTFTDNGNGTYKVDPAISMTYLTNDGTGHIAVAESIQQDVSMLGINLEIKTEDWNVFLEDRKSGNFTLAREGWLADYNDPVNMLEIFTSDSGNNDMQLGKGTPVSSSPDWSAYDALIDQIRTTTDFAARVDLMHDAEDMLMDTWAVIPIYYYNDVYMQKSNVTGVYATIFGMKYFMYATKSAQ